MRNLLLAISIILLHLTSLSQSAVITNSLHQKLNISKASDIVKVNIVFVDQVHHGLLNAEFKAKNIPVKEF